MTPIGASRRHHAQPVVAGAGVHEWLQGAQAWWQRAARLAGIWSVRQGGAPAIAQAQARRFARLVAHARLDSPFYRDAYRDLPPGPVALAQLPVVTRRALMQRFDDWVTDPAVTRAAVDAFGAERNRIGDRFLGRYLVWKSSGTSGEPGIYVQDADAVATYDALVLAQMQTAAVAAGVAAGAWLHGGRAALIAATGDHYASIASWQRQARDHPWSATCALSVLRPVAEWVAALGRFQPAYLASYPTVLALLAGEQAAGRLDIAPDVIWSGGERMTPAMAAAIRAAFGCPLVEEYGASECLSIAFGCAHGWLHVNADWLILEPVDERHRPVPPGTLSHTVLLTNLANDVQPLIRYDLGDRVLAQDGPCACGNPLPAIRVEGRCDDVMTLADGAGNEVRLLPLALTTVVEEAAALHRFQILQQGADRVALRFDPQEPGYSRTRCRAAAAALGRFLARQSLPDVRVVQDRRAPASNPRSGKFRQVVALHVAHDRDSDQRGRAPKGRQ